MFLEAKNIPEIQQLLTGSHNAIEKIRGAEISLTVPLFLALTHRHAKKEGNGELAQHISALALPGLSQAIRCLEPGALTPSPDPFGAPRFDLYRLCSKDDLLSHEWPLFYDRFRRTFAADRPGKMYRATGGVLGEMGDNVVRHAFDAENRPCFALAGFYVVDDQASFCVADRGQGFLSSLRRSPVWASLSTDQDALSAVVHKHATSSPGEKEGGGFKQLFNSLLDFNGLVILRSGSCTCRLENCGEVRRITTKQSTPVVGSAVTVVISVRGKPSEMPLKP